MTPADVVLEPSTGTGHLFVELAGASLVLNEVAESRAGILGQIFPAVITTRSDAAHINDHLDARIVPSVVLMNPPFSAAVHVDRGTADASLRHVGSALARLPEGGRLVAITRAEDVQVPDYAALHPGYGLLLKAGFPSDPSRPRSGRYSASWRLPSTFRR